MSNSNTFSRDNKAAKSNKSVAKPKDKVIGSSSTEDWLNDYDYDYVSMMGYRDYSPLRHSSAINIYTPDGTIDMSETGTPLMANGQYLPPYSGIHNMGTQHVREVALAKNGGSLKKYQAGDQVVNLSNQFIYPEQINRFANDALQNRALACQGPDCLAGANTYYNKYVAPKFGLPNTWKLNELYGIVSGDPNQPYGTTADSWDLAALMQAKGAIQNYAAPLYEDDKKTRRDYKDAKRYWNLRSDEEKKNLYSQMALGTLVNFGDYGGLAYGERLQGSNEKAGLYPSRHSARVVGFTETGVPVIYDYGHITRIDDPVFDFPITNVTTPKELAKYNYQYVKDWQDKNKAKLDYDPKEKLLLTKGSQRPGEDPFTEDELKYVEGINKNIANLMQITGASQDDIIKAGKVAFGIMEGETRGGRGAPKAKLKELVKSVTPFTDESSKGLTRIKPEMQAGDETNKYSQYLKALGLNPKDLDLWDPEQAALATTALILSRKGNIEGVDKWYLRAQQHNTPGVGPKNTERLKQADKDYANNVIQNASRLYSTKTGYGLPETEEWMTKKQSERLKKQAEESKKEGAKALSEALKPKAMASESTGYSPKIIPISQLTKKEMGGESNWLDEYDLPKAQLGLELLTVDNQSYDPRGEFSSYTQPGPLAFVYPDNYSEENIRDKPVTKPAPAAKRDLVTEPDQPVKKPVKKPAEKQYKVKERYQAFFPNPAKISTKAITPATTYVSGKEQNTLSSMPAYKRLLTQAKEAAEIKRINNVLNATANAASFFPGIPSILGNAASAAYNVEDGDYILGALQMIPDRTSKTISGFNNLISGKELYDFHTQPEPSYGNFLPYLTDEYKRELFKQKPLTVEKDGGWLDQYDEGGEKPWGEMTPKERAAYLDAKEKKKPVTKAEAAVLAKQAEAKSRAQAKKEYYEDYVREGTKKALTHPLLNLPATFTPEGAAISAMQSLVNYPVHLANNEYGMAALDLLGAVPFSGKLGEAAKQASKKVIPAATKQVESLFKAPTFINSLDDLNKIKTGKKFKNVSEAKKHFEVFGETNLEDVLSKKNVDINKVSDMYNSLGDDAEKLKFFNHLYEVVEGSKIQRAVKSTDELLGEIASTALRKQKDAPDLKSIVKSANKKLEKGLGIKKGDMPIYLEINKNNPYNVDVKIGDTKTGYLNLSPVGTKGVKLSEMLKGQKPLMAKNYQEYQNFINATQPGFAKSGDFPFTYIDAIGHPYSNINLKGQGYSGELVEALNKSLKEKGARLYSGSTGHTPEGAARYANLLQKGLVENISPRIPGSYNLKYPENPLYMYKKYGGWLDELDELDEDYRYGGVKRHKKMPRGTTKNLVRGINKLFIPDPKLFGPFGRRVFDPNSKFEDGGWLQDYE